MFINQINRSFHALISLLLVAALAGCGGGDRDFLEDGPDVDPSAPVIASMQLVIGGQTDSITLSPGQETSIAVRVTHEDDSIVYLDPSDVTFEYQRNQSMLTKSSALGDASTEDAPFVIDGFMLKVPFQMDENVAVVAIYGDDRTEPVMVEVHDKVIEHLQLTPAEQMMVKGGESLYRLDAFYVDGSTARLASDVLTGGWLISDAAVAQVDNDYFEALGAGQAVITYELNGVRSNEAIVKVSGEMVTAIDITPTQLDVAKGAKGEIRAMATLSDGSKLDITSSVSWSEHSAIIVDKRGLVMGVAEQANIPLTAAFSGVQSPPALVTVKGADISALVLSPSNATVTLSEQGRSLSLVAQYTDGTALPYTDVVGVVYTLDNDIADVDVNGDVHPKSEGVAVVSAKAQDRHGNWVESNSVALSVTASPLVGITLHADSSYVPQGVFTTLRAMGEYVDGRVEDISSQVNWQSSAPSVLTVADGIAYGTSVGQADVTAYLGGVLSDGVHMAVTDAKLTALSTYFTSPKADADGMVILPVGLRGQAEAMASFSDGSVHVVTDQVTWHSGDDAIVSVDPQGLFTGQAKGEASGYASFSAGGITIDSGKGSIKVTDATPVRLDILPSQVNLVKGLSAKLHAVATYSDGHVADASSAAGLSWTTQDSSIATLSNQGGAMQVQGVGVGSTTIKATWAELEAPALVKVEEKTLTGMTLNPITQTLAKGSKASMQVLGFYSDNSQQNITSSVSDYRSSDNHIVIVDTSGEVSALASGSVTLSASYGGFEATAQLVVPEAKVTALRIGGAASIVAGTTEALSATAIFDDGSELDVTSAAYWQSNASGVIVDAGSVWAKDGSDPSVAITATFGGQQAQKTLSITSATLSSLSLSPSSVHIIEGATQTYTLEATYSDNTKVDVSTQTTWTSSNNIIAGFTPNTAILTASTAGEVTVTATFGGMSAQSVVYIADRTEAVESLRVTPTTTTLPEGGTSAIRVEANYSTDPSVFVDVTAQTAWQVDTDYAVIGEGVVVARKAHSAPITATAIYGGKQAPLIVTITNAMVERLQLTSVNPTLAKGYSTSLVASAFFSNGLVTQPAATDISWTLDSGEGVTISNGVVTATEAGKTATIKAVYQGQSATAVITTSSATLDSVLLTDLSDTPLLHSMLLAKGMSVDAKLLGQLSDGTSVNLEQSKVTYTITGDAVTQSGGTLNANQEGVSDIRASYVDNGQTLTSQVVVMAVSGAEVASITVTTGDVTLVKGMTDTPQAHATLTDGISVDITPNVTWTVADDSVAKFASHHTLVGLAAGKTTYTARFGSKTATANVVVNDTTLTHLSVSPQFTTVTAGQAKGFVATANFNNGTSQELDTEVSWSVSNSNATIDSDGKLTAVSAGSVAVIATLSSDPSQQVQANVTIVERSVQSVNVTLSSSSIAAGQSTSATARVTYTDSTSEDVTSQVAWVSSDPGVALVTNGYIRGLKSGSSGIQATFRGETSTAETLTVSNATVSSVQLTPASVTLAKGYNAPLTLIATYSDNSTAEIPASNVTWSVDSGEGVTISAGVVTATEVGKIAIIKAVYQGQSATAAITTSGAIIDSIELLDVATDKPLASTVLPVGGTHNLKVVASLSDGSVQPLTSGVAYQTSDDTVATIASDGAITALKEGVANISASYASDGQTFTSNATIINVTGASVKSIAIVPDFNPTGYRIAGLEYGVSVQAVLMDSTTVNITSLVTWQSSDETVASVINARGMFEAKKGGESDITAHYAGFSDTLNVKVIDARLTSLDVTPTMQSLSVGSTQQYQAIAHYSNGAAVNVTDQVSWSSVPSSMATIDASTGLARAVSIGSVSVTAAKGGISTSVPLTVNDKPVQSIQISANSTSLPEGQDASLTAVVTYTDGSQEVNRAQDVLWVSSEPLNGVVKNGQFYALAKGDTDLTATFRGKTSNVLTMNITDATLSSLTLTPTTSSVAAGQTQRYALMGTYTNGQQHDVTSLATWVVTAKDGSATTIASMATKGEVSTNTSGEVLVTVTVGALSTDAGLTITNKSVKQVVFNQGQDIVLKKGDTATPEVTVIYSDGTSSTAVSTDRNLTFRATTAIPTVAEFDMTNKGQINTFSEGKAQAWVVYQSGADAFISEKVDVVVTGKVVRSIAFTQTPPALPKGTQGSFVLEATYSDGTTAEVTHNAIWVSSDTDKVTVLNGEVTASRTNTGDSTITANYEGKTATHTMTVSGATLTHVTLDVNSMQLHQGLTKGLTLTAYYTDGSTQEQTTTASWSSADNTLASVSQGTVTGVAQGSTIITATLNGETVSADVFVIERSVDRIETQIGAMVINKGASTTFDVYAYYEGDTTTAVNVTNQAEISVDTNVAYVTNGQIYGHAQGTTNLNAIFKGKQATEVKDFTVADKAILGLQLTPATQTLPKGVSGTYTLTAIYTDHTTEVIDNTGATWSIVPDGITGMVPTSVTVNQGEVTANEDSGVATVKVAYQGVEATAQVTTTNATLESIVLMDVSKGAPLKPMTLHHGQAHYLLAVNGLYSDGSSAALTTGVTYKQDGDAVVLANLGGHGMYVNDHRTTDASLVYAEYTPAGGETLGTARVPVTVTGAQAASLSIVPSFDASQDLMKGLSYSLKAIAALDDGTQVDVTSIVNWQSSNSAIGEMSNVTKGQLNTKADGGITITASYGTYNDAIAVTVADVTLQSITLTPANQSMDVGQHQRYHALGHYDSGVTLDITNQVSWSSSDSAVATINNQGDVNAVAPGVITVHASKDGIDGQTNLTVKVVGEVTSVHIELSQAHSLAIGESAPLNALIYFKDGANNDYDAAKRVYWKVEDPSIGYVMDGVWYARAVGNTVVTAAFGGITSNEESVHVNTAAVTSLAMTPSSKVDLAKGRTYQLAVEATYTNGGTVIQTDAANWSTTDNAVVSVSQEGLVTAVGNGTDSTVTITASFGGKTASVEVEVTSAVTDSLELNGNAAITLNQGESLALPTLWRHSDNSTKAIDLTDTNFSFKSDNDAIASFNAINKLNANREGVTQVWVEYADGADTVKSEKVAVLVQSKKVTGLSFAQSQVSIPKGESAQFILEAAFSDGTTLDVTSSAVWGSSDLGVFAVSRGVVTASDTIDLTVKSQATLTATYAGIPQTFVVTVTGATLERITLSPTSVKLNQNLTQQLSIKGYYSDGGEYGIAASNFNWTSSAGSRVGVDTNGLVTANAEGNATITATAKTNASISANIDVYVVEKAVKSLRVELTKSTFKVGESQEIKVWATYEGSTAEADVTSQTIFGSASGHVGIFAGYITGLTEGTDKITASFGGVDKEQNIEVSGVVYTSLILIADSTAIEKGGTTNLTLQAVGVNGQIYDSLDLTNVDWTIDEPTVVSITNLTLSGLTPGDATLSARYEGVGSNQININVKEERLQLMAWVVGERTVSTGDTILAAGDTAYLKVTYDGVAVDIKDVELTALSGGSLAYFDYLTGEFFSKDSSHFPDCTQNGRRARDLMCMDDILVSYNVKYKGEETTFTVPFVGLAIDKIKVHQLFPEPEEGATGVDLVNTTRAEVPVGSARQLFATITYSDGTQDEHVTSNSHGGGFLKVVGYSGDEWEVEVLNYGDSYYYKGVEHLSKYHYSFGQFAKEDKNGWLIAGARYKDGAFLSEAPDIGDEYEIGVSFSDLYTFGLNPVDTHGVPNAGIPNYAVKSPDLMAQGLNKNQDLTQVDTETITIKIVDPDEHVNSTWGVSVPQSIGDFVFHPAISGKEYENATGVIYPYIDSKNNIRAPYIGTLGVAADICQQVYPETHIGSHYGIAGPGQITDALEYINDNFGVSGEESMQVHFGWRETIDDIVWTDGINTLTGNVNTRLGIFSSTAIGYNWIDATKVANRLGVQCAGCLSGEAISTNPEVQLKTVQSYHMQCK
ncbi:Ig-like domain-containing protein [Shewanella sp. Isolate13]|uniref:Ig-like domain-containing protein n=1 Tax=Shewanella sp. Isolate13 TaxID=2908531 RepID=UPI001EFDC851|nr:Ig-like domain-containing protein [Shewanella sp. Isolate13]MCG9731123.1 Ig-like domain-containing protein [Shewanella sp. Isolate13]